MPRHHQTKAVASSGTPNNELIKFIEQVMASQPSGQDACPTKLLVAKRQLTQLHTHMHSVAVEINNTSVQVQDERDKKLIANLRASIGASNTAYAEWQVMESEMCNHLSLQLRQARFEFDTCPNCIRSEKHG